MLCSPGHEQHGVGPTNGVGHTASSEELWSRRTCTLSCHVIPRLWSQEAKRMPACNILQRGASIATLHWLQGFVDGYLVDQHAHSFQSLLGGARIHDHSLCHCSALFEAACCGARPFKMRPQNLACASSSEQNQHFCCIPPLCTLCQLRDHW
jgi:hypothetical protein